MLKVSRPAGPLVLLAVALVSTPPAVVAQKGPPPAKKMVCWTDNAGQKACGSSIPPEFAGKQKTVLDSHGRVKETIAAEPTPEQRAAQQQQAEAEEAARREAERQAAYERSLLATYSRPEELAALRDDRLATLDASYRLNRKSLKRDETSLRDLRKRLPPEGQPTPPKLLEQISSFEKTVAANRVQLEETRRKRQTVCESFERDIRRFQELKFGQVSFNSPCPALDDNLPGDAQEAALAAAARFFEGWVAMHGARHAELFDLYAPEASVQYVYQSGTGKTETAELTRDEYREELSAAWKGAGPQGPPVFAEIEYASADKAAVKITGQRTAAAGQAPQRFHLVVRPDASGALRIIEQWSAARF